MRRRGAAESAVRARGQCRGDRNGRRDRGLKAAGRIRYRADARRRAYRVQWLHLRAARAWPPPRRRRPGALPLRNTTAMSVASRDYGRSVGSSRRNYAELIASRHDYAQFIASQRDYAEFIASQRDYADSIAQRRDYSESDCAVFTFRNLAYTR